MFEKIIVALDTTDHYLHLFNRALALAQATSAELTLLNIVASQYDYSTSLGYYSGTMGYPVTMEDSFWDASRKAYADRKEASFRILSELSSRAKRQGVNAELLQKNGEPGNVICEVAAAQKADLVIVGSHRRRGLGEFLMGSVSSHVMHRAPCSVMIAHRPLQTEKKDLNATAQVTAS